MWVMLRVRGVCFSTSSRAIVLPEGGTSVGYRKGSTAGKKTVDMNAYQPDEDDPPKGTLITPAERAIEEIKRQTTVLSQFMHGLELQAADQERFERLQSQNAALTKELADAGTWLDMIRQALKHHDDGELSGRQFANEVDAAIKGWEGR